MNKLNILLLMLLLLSACATNPETDNPAPPNIIVILADDMGYSDIEPFGGEIPTPNLNKLADHGLTMTQFYNAGRCCPTRASILTGLYQHQAGVGNMDGSKKDSLGNIVPSYQGHLNQSCVTIAEVLKTKGYQTYLSGKWHVGRTEPYWPSKRGFKNSFAYVYGAGSYFNLEPFRSGNDKSLLLYNDSIVDPSEDFYLTRAISDHAVNFIDQSTKKGNPFFMYVAYTAPHWPLHALEEDIEKFIGKYSGGWDSLRQVRYQKMQAMDMLADSWPLTDRFVHEESPALTPSWDSLSTEEKQKWERRMAVYTAMVYRMDVGIGRIVEQLKASEQYENTLIMFLSDNGACHEPVYLWDISYDQSGPIGSPNSFDAYGFPWANASNTPLRMFKHWTMEGGISTPFIAHWPAQIKQKIVNKSDYAHIIDIMATSVDIANTSYPSKFNNNKILPMEGVSLMPLFNNQEFPDDRMLFWEHQGNIAVRQGNMKLVRSHQGYVENKNEWQLFNIMQDRVEVKNLIDEQPKKARQLQDAYRQWAKRVGVFRWDDLQ